MAYRKPMPGKKKVYCNDCEHIFWVETRDADSPSLADCPECSSVKTEYLVIYYLDVNDLANT